ncbi:hypothetical protein [Ferruginibacter sp.]
MKRIFFMIGISALIAAGCNNNGAKNKEEEAKVEPTKTNELPDMLTDVRSTKDVKVILAQNWESKEDAQEAELSGGSATFDMPYRGFSFFADGSVVQNPRDNIRFGTWALDDAGKTITINYKDGGKAQYTIDNINAKNLALTNTADKKQIEYKADGKVQKDPNNNPFYGANNQWRIKPSKPETDAEIKQRVLQHVGFFHTFLNDNIVRGGNSITFMGLPTVFVWYSGGISVMREEKVTDKWINCFYNKEQALKGQRMLEDIITKKYKWDKEETNWVKKDANVVKQIYDTLSAAK